MQLMLGRLPAQKVSHTGGRGCLICGRLAGARKGLVVRAATTVPAKYKNVAPAGDRVFVKVDSSDEKTTSGILLPSSAQKKPTQGEVVGAGDVKAVKAGDEVVYSKYAGTEIKLQGIDHVILKEDDVIGVLKSKNIAELKPLGDRILVKVAESERQSKGGVLLTDASADQPTLGTDVITMGPQREHVTVVNNATVPTKKNGQVVAVGSGKADDKGNVVKSKLEVGATVLYQKYAGVEFEGDDEAQYIVIKDSDVLASLA